MPDTVDAAMLREQRPAVDPALDRRRRQPDRQQLAPRDDAVLTTRDPNKVAVLTLHTGV